GRNGGAGVDMFKHVYRHQGPVARLFKAVMRSDRVRERFRSLLLAFLEGPLSTASMEREVRLMAGEIGSEMPWHCARWRRPLSVAVWQGHVDRMIAFTHARPDQVRAQLDAFLKSPVP
ncbi:MAG: CotH kinase family protein, partial [Flavobacteriales bacterium]|nr:CotH kinase family protein [Flavobacteriales bacterium]